MIYKARSPSKLEKERQQREYLKELKNRSRLAKEAGLIKLAQHLQALYQEQEDARIVNVSPAYVEGQPETEWVIYFGDNNDPPKKYLEGKWEYVKEVSRICAEKGLDDFMEANKYLDNPEFRDWLRARLASGYKTGKDPAMLADEILDYVSWKITSETIYTDKD